MPAESPESASANAAAYSTSRPFASSSAARARSFAAAAFPKCASHTACRGLVNARPSRACRPVAPTRSRAPTWSAPPAFVRNGRAPEPGCATSSPPQCSAGSASDFAFHSRLVAREKREIVTGDQKLREFQFALRSPLQGIRSLCEPVEAKDCGWPHVIREWRCPDLAEWPSRRCLNSPFILAGAAVRPIPPIMPRRRISRGYVCAHDSRVCNSFCKFPVTCRS